MPLSEDHRVVTVAARNYLPRAAVLAESYQRVHPDRKLTVLLVDAADGDYPPNAAFDILTRRDLPMDADEFCRMAMIYNVTEFCTALKPWAIEMMLDAGADVVTYFDPDIEIFAPLDYLAELARDHSIVLTPHTLFPIPRDGLRPTEEDIMQAGAFNLGHLTVSKDATVMLEWWKQRLKRHSVFAPQRALFVDQRWFDVVPGYFRHSVLRDPGCNVAYWNLHERRVTRTGVGVLVDGEPLRFFHYSGYEFNRPWMLNKYCSDRPRVLLSEQSVVNDLCLHYGLQVRAAETYYGPSTGPYGFGSFADGTLITNAVREIYRNALINADDGGASYPPVPFSGSDFALLEWFRSPEAVGTDVSRYILGLWETRADLQAAFPFPQGRSKRDLYGWMATITADMDPEFAAARDLLMGPPLPDVMPLTETVGVNVSGYLTSELGVGEAGRLILECVRASGLPHRTSVNTQTSNRKKAEFEAADGGNRYPITVAVVNDDRFADWSHTTGFDLVGQTYVIGHWCWELEEFRPRREALDLVDEIWTLSEFCRTAIQQVTDKPVFVFPFPVKKPGQVEGLDRNAIELPKRPYFLFAFDYFSVIGRKNPFGLVEAFKRAFPEGGGPNLVIKSINGDRCLSEREQLRLLCQDRPDVFLLDTYLASGQVRALMNEADAYVSLHRSEGLGLTIAEAMSLGKPVIATGYSGNLDFMYPDISLFVPYQLVRVGAGCDPYPATATWAEPDLDTAASHMRWVASHPHEAAELGSRARRSILAERTVAEGAEFIRKRVTSIMSQKAAHPHGNTDGGALTSPEISLPSGPVHSDRAMTLIHTAPDVSSPSRMPRLAKRYRQLIYRLLGHHDERANEQLTALAVATSHIETEIARSDRDLRSMVESQTRQVTKRADRLAYETTAIEDKIRNLHLRHERVTRWHRELEERIAHLSDLTSNVEAIEAHLNDLTRTVSLINSEMIARPYTATKDAGTYVSSEGARIMGYRPQDRSLSTYASFEDIYRGTDEFVADSLRPYLSLLADKAPVLDLGCGRGELLQLLTSVGVKSFGVDLDHSMVARCDAKGLRVRHGDGLEFLRDMEAGCLGAITAIQVIEHLDPALLRQLFEISFRTLRGGGVLLAETVNPHSPPALKAFWLDLTHRRPLYPESMLMLADECGFEEAKIVFPNGTGDLDFDLRMCGSYAVVDTRGLPEVTNSAEEARQAQALIQRSAAARPVSRRQPGPVER